ncbi:MAG: hypothetical protein JXB13_22670, partial [Phycisphaerae bacterium]|nr:hypothetical protein [Phycisphaerae bacterium]
MPYYYLAATLPMLSLEGPSPFAFDGLRARCNEQFSKHDRAALDELAEPGAGDADHPFVIAWRGRERALRGAIARLRAARLQRDAGPALEPDAVPDPTLQRRVEEALGRGNPAERELALDRLRWELLE